jgi:glutaconyl-CoA decarboxylase
LKEYRVTVDGHTYTVIVEEIAAEKDRFAGTGVAPPSPPAAAAPAAAPLRETAAPQGSVPAAANALVVESPMPGEIIDLIVKPGDTVNEGDVLLILEAMKMENEITAPRAGTISAVHIRAGDTVGSGAPLVEIA